MILQGFTCAKNEGLLHQDFTKGICLIILLNGMQFINYPKRNSELLDPNWNFFYPSVAGSLPNLYNPGNWSAECGPLANNNNGITNGNLTTGKFSFWVQSDLGCGNITVVLNGASRVISNYHSSNPGCNVNGSANFELSGGTYNYTASCSGYSWANTITVINGQCSTRQLTL